MDKIIKNITNRLSDSNTNICLYDPEDKSIIVIDNDLLTIIRKYYESMLLNG